MRKSTQDLDKLTCIEVVQGHSLFDKQLRHPLSPMRGLYLLTLNKEGSYGFMRVLLFNNRRVQSYTEGESINGLPMVRLWDCSYKRVIELLDVEILDDEDKLEGLINKVRPEWLKQYQASKQKDLEELE